jgi:hypothetical protein
MAIASASKATRRRVQASRACDYQDRGHQERLERWTAKMSSTKKIATAKPVMPNRSHRDLSSRAERLAGHGCGDEFPDIHESDDFHITRYGCERHDTSKRGG